MKVQNSVRALLAEFIGSLFLLTVVNGVAIMFSSALGGGDIEVVITSALAVPALLFVIIEIFGPVSGAHFNPLVTLVMFFEKKITMMKSFQYVVSQVVGGVVGIMISHLMFAEQSGGLLSVSEIGRSGSHYFSEFIGTFMLVFVVLALTTFKSDKATFMIPFLVGANILATSSTMFANPQVTFARIFTDSVAGIRPFDGLMFILMQVMGTLFAYLLYQVIFQKEEE